MQTPSPFVALLSQATIDRQLRRTGLPSLLFTILALASPGAQAGWPCWFTGAYPEVTRLEADDDRLVIELSGYFSEDREHDANRLRFARDVGGNWSRLPDAPPTRPAHSGQSKPCLAVPPDTKAAREYARQGYDIAAFNEHISTCTTDGVKIYGGLAFYGAEGAWGIGGFVEKDIASGHVRYRRPAHLWSQSINFIEAFDSGLYMGTTHHGECSGPPPGYGLKVYENRYGAPTVFEIPEMCGFAIRGMLVHDEKLWVASEMGLAYRTAGDQAEWVNLLPAPDHPDLMRPMSCGDLYVKLLRSPAFAAHKGFDMGFAFEDLWRRLSALRPAFTSRYLRALHGHEEAKPTM